MHFYSEISFFYKEPCVGMCHRTKFLLI